MSSAHKGTVKVDHYRGYCIAHDDTGADIWSGGAYIETVAGPDAVAEARKIIDDWMNAK